MAGTYSQIYIQYVIVVNKREHLLRKEWRSEVFRYISGIIKAKGQKPIIVNGVGNHVHIFVGLKPSMRISDLARDIKNNSSKFINDQGWLKSKFSWQEGYGAFSYAYSQIERVYQYILNQEEHHRKKTFKDEYLKLLEKFEIEYDEKYLFDWLD
nr:IS200/IS605 family transposase [uncultured Brumimicrobium sp.]